MLDLSIIIVNWNTKNLIMSCLDSIYQTTKSIGFEIIVIDNASTDGSISAIEKKFSHVILVKNNENKGFAAANNQGIKQAQGEFILLLNSDTIVLDNAIGKSVKFLKSRPEIGALGCKLLYPDGSLQPSANSRFGSLDGALLAKTGIFHLLPRASQEAYKGPASYANAREVAMVKGAFLLLRRKALDKVGTLDERFFMYAEETDLCFRLRGAGWKIYFYPDAEVIHHGGGSIQSFEQKMKIQRQRTVSRLLFIKKHHKRMYYILYRYLGVLYNASKLLGLLISGKKNNERTKVIQAKLRAFFTMEV